MSKWKINGVDMERNPESFVPRHKKDVTYREGVIGREIRVVPVVNPVESFYEATWRLVTEDFRNKLHDLYVSDESFTLKTHLTSNPREAWQVKIDEFFEEYATQGGGQGQRFNVTALLRVLQNINDPIISKKYSAYPYAFLVDNTTNHDMYDAIIFIRGVGKQVVNPTITQTFLNILQNPGFEQVESSGTVSVWEDDALVWESDIVLFWEGNRCVRTYVLNSPLRQIRECPADEDLTIAWSSMGDEAGSAKVRLTLRYYDAADVEISSYQDTRDITTQWQDFWFTVTTPSNTAKVAVELEKVAGTETNTDYIYVDRVLVRLGTSTTAPTYTDHEHRTLTYNGTIADGDVLKIDLLSETAMINDADVSDSIEGHFFYFPVGKSLLLFSEDAGNAGDTEAIIRYNEVFK